MYNFGKEDLLRGIGVKESYYFHNQIEFLKNSYHNNNTYYYMSHKFWKSIYHLGYDNGGGDLTNEFNIYNTDEIH